MLRKIAHISNLGRFRNCQQKAPDLTKLVLIFAGNGRGKTTLSALFRSLGTGHPRHLLERATLGQHDLPTVRLQLADGATIQFRDGRWTETVPTIRVFDSTFVSENVFSGEFVTRDHKRKLCSVVLGSQGGALIAKFNEIDGNVSAASTELDRQKKALVKYIGATASVDEIVRSVLPSNIEDQINLARTQVRLAELRDQISKRPGFRTIPLPAISEATISVFANSLDDIDRAALATVERHMTKHGVSSTAWISDVLQHVVDNNCPFCGQSLSAVNLISAYRAVLKEAAQQLVSDIQKVERGVSQAISESAIELMVARLETNFSESDFWALAGCLTILPALSQQEIEIALRKVGEQMNAVLAKKQRNPFESIALSELPFDEIESALAPLKSYNEKVRALQEEVVALKSANNQATLADIQKHLRRLELIRERHNGELKAAVDTYAAFVARQETLGTEKISAKAALDSYIQSSMTRTQERINALLTRFAADFQLSKTRTTYVGRAPNTEYQVSINNVGVDVSDVQPADPIPTFGTTLSGGDKSALALAFFIASLEAEPTLNNVIAIFDDPFASQDRSRKTQTAVQIKALAKKCAQVIVLSHDPHFLSEVRDGVEPAQTSCLQISKQKTPDARIDAWDMAAELQSAYVTQFKRIRSFVQNEPVEGGALDVARDMRPVIEEHLRLRNPGRFGQEIRLAQMIDAIHTAGTEDPLYDTLEDVRAINSFDRRYHHDNSGEPDDDEVKAHAKMLLGLIGTF